MSRLPETGPSLRRIIEQQKRQANRAADASPYTRSGTSVTAEDEVTVDGALIVTGPLDVTGPAAFAGDTTIGGNAAITGTLSLPAGIIDNAALTSPVGVGDFDHTEDDFDPPGGVWYTASSVILTTPAGFSQAVVTATAYAWIYNTSAVDEQIRVRASIAGAIGPEDVEITSGLARLLTTFPTRVTGLVTGGTFTIACQTYSVTDFTAHNTNMARISGTVLWLR